MQVFSYDIYFQNIFIVEPNIVIVTNLSTFTYSTISTGWNIFWDCDQFNPQKFRMGYGTQTPNGMVSLIKKIWQA